MRLVRVHCGSAHVRGRARKYSYYIASLFLPRMAKNGKLIYYNAAKLAGPFRSQLKTEREARRCAMDKRAIFVEGYGSLHNKGVHSLKYKLSD